MFRVTAPSRSGRRMRPGEAGWSPVVDTYLPNSEIWAFYSLGVRRLIGLVARKREGRKGEDGQKGSRKEGRCSTDRWQETKVQRGSCGLALR